MDSNCSIPSGENKYNSINKVINKHIKIENVILIGDMNLTLSEPQLNSWINLAYTI